MKVLTAIFSIILGFAIVRASNLKSVSVVYRHGDRSPAFVYPTDPHPASIWENGLGQLTNAGKNQTYELGKYFRDRYNNFLPSKYHEDDIHVMSSDISRALMSAYCVLAGLYEPQGDDVWLDFIHWQPIPVHSVPMNLDNLMYNNASCPKFQQILNDHVFVGNSEIVDKYAGIMKQVMAYAGVPMLNVSTMDILISGLGFYDCFFIEERYGLELPEWTKKFYPEPLREIAKFVYSMSTYDDQLKRLHCGPLLKDIIQHMEEAKQGTSKIKMWQYSAHDSTIVDILRCMDVYDGYLIPFASAVFLELYETENDFEIVINYRKNGEKMELEIPGCKSPCPFDTFRELVNDVIPDNWEEECKI